MARYTRKFFELDQLALPKEERHLAKTGDIFTGNPYDENCSCEFEATHDGRPVMLKRVFACDYCKAKEVIESANRVKAQRREEITVRLSQIDKEAGPRSTREELIAIGRNGFNNKIETLENEAKALRTELAGL